LRNRIITVKKGLIFQFRKVIYSKENIYVKRSLIRSGILYHSEILKAIPAEIFDFYMMHPVELDYKEIRRLNCRISYLPRNFIKL